MAEPARIRYQRPFLKWAGNKYRILDHILDRLPPGDRLIEPFAGSGAVFLNTRYPRYLVNDINPDLIDLFRAVQRGGAAFVARARRLFHAGANTERVYYRNRERFNACDDPEERAALLIYLNRHGYNGLVRYNSRGGFNVPFGRYRQPRFPEAELLAFHRRAVHADFVCGGFEAAMDQARPGDVVYADPPYVPLSRTANFRAYSRVSFDSDAQWRLARKAEELAARGVPVLVSNHDLRFTREAYHAASVTAFDVRRFISCNGAGRARVGELLALFTGDGSGP